MSKQVDISWILDYPFVRFLPESAAGERVWREMHSQGGGDVVAIQHKECVIKQIRDAGYIVRKKRASVVTDSEADDLLNELSN